MKRSLPNTTLSLLRSLPDARSSLPVLAIMLLCSMGAAAHETRAYNDPPLHPASPSAATAAGNQAGQAGPAGQLPGDSIIIFKNNLSRSHKIALYTDALQTAVFFHVKGHQGNVYHLYVFDLDGQLIKHTEARSEQTTYIKKMEKGIYLFEVFNDDDKIGNGQIAVM